MAPTDVPVDPHTPTEASSADTLGGATEPRSSGTAPRGASTYQLGEVIGRGGMGEVLLAHDQLIGRDVALKRLRSDVPSRELVDRFLREAKIQARLDHPAIAPVHELGFDAAGRPFFTMKRVSGTTLAAALDAGTETQQRMLRVVVDVALAVELAHSRRVVHRDLKPSNIMLGDYGEVYVLDWGVARVLANPDDSKDGAPDVASLDGETKVGSLLGTPGYMAPEQARGAPVGTAADVYALGSIVFEILTGETLHPRGHGALASTLDGLDPSPIRRAPTRGIAPELDAVCRGALATDPAARPTARGLANAIQSYLDGDRDLARRRELATELVAESRAASAAGDQAVALNTAGRAVAFDPDSTVASNLIIELLVDAKNLEPAEVQEELAAEEVRSMKERSKRAIGPYMALFGMIPLLPLMHVLSWPTLVVFYVAVTMGVVAIYFNTRKLLPLWVPLGAHLLVAIMFTRIAGPFVFTPVFICAILLTATTLPALVDRPWIVIGWAFTAVVLPMVLEAIGVLARSWSLDADGLTSFGTIFAAGETVDQVILVVGNIGAVLVVGFFARVIGIDRRDAQRRVSVQLWRLHQLLPRATRTAATPS